MSVFAAKGGPDVCISDAELRQMISDSLEKIVEEVSVMRQTERGNRSDDKRSESAMEDRKRQGYF